MLSSRFILPDPVVANLLSCMTNERELQRCSGVCKQWNKHVNFLNQESEALCKKHNIYGKSYWLSHKYHIGNVPRLTSKIIERLLKNELSLCILYPSKVDGKPLEVMMKEIFFKFLSCELKNVNESEDEDFYESFFKCIHTPVGRKCSYWFIITKNCSPKLNRKDNVLSVFKALVKTESAYKIPNAYELFLSYIIQKTNIDNPKLFDSQLITYNEDSLGYISIKTLEQSVLFDSSLCSREIIDKFCKEVRPVQRFV